MTTQSASHVTIDEQLANDIGLLRVEAAQYPHDDYRRAQLNGIADRLKRIKEARDVEPRIIVDCPNDTGRVGHFRSNNGVVYPVGTKFYGPEVLDLLAAEKLRVAELDDQIKQACEMRDMGLAIATKNKELAEQEHERGDKWMADCKLAESRLAKVMEALRNPTPAMLDALDGCHDGRLYSQDMVHGPRAMRATEFRAMSSVLLSELTKDKNSI